MQPPFPARSIQRLEAVDWEFFRPGFGYRIPATSLDHEPSRDLRARQLHAYAQGREGAAAILRGKNTSLAALGPPPPRRESGGADDTSISWWEGVGEALGKHLDSPDYFDGGEVDWLQILGGAEALLQAVPGGDDGGRLAALRAAAALEASDRVDWVKVQGGWDRGVLPRVAAELDQVSPGVAHASWYVHGRACGAALARFHRPQSIDLGRALPTLPPSFFHGLGRALGERWGPQDVVPGPGGLPAGMEAGLAEGYRDGVARRWLDAQGIAPPRLSTLGAGVEVIVAEHIPGAACCSSRARMVAP